MIRLRKILLCDFVYYIILALVLIVTLFRLDLVGSSNYSLDSNSVIGLVVKITSDGDLLKLDIKDESGEVVKVNYYFDTLDEKKFVLKTLKLGITVKIEGEFYRVKGKSVPNTFDYRKYLERKGIYFYIRASEIEVISDSMSLFYKVKNFIIDYFDSFKSGAYLKILILGISDDVKNQVLSGYREIGVSHLFAISGTQVTVVADFLLLVLRKVGVKEKGRYFVVNLFVIFYLFLTGMQAAILRAVIFFILGSINKIYYLYVKQVNLFLLVLAITLIIDPNYVFDLGFLYSYLISFVLIVLSNRLSKNYFYGLAQTSIYSFLVSLPITLYSFYQVNLLSILYNLFFVPYVSYILFPLSFIVIFVPFLDNVLMFFIDVLESITLFCGNINFLKLIFPKVSMLFYFLYFVFFIILFVFKKKILYILFIIFVFVHYNCYLFVKNDFVSFIDVGHGDSSLIVLNNEVALIDTGGKYSYEKEEWKKKDSSSFLLNTTIPYMKSLGIRKIDTLILTHGDYDHMGEAINLVNNFKVEKVIFNCGEFNDLEKDLIKVLDKKKIKYYSCIKELNIDNNKLYFLNNKDYDNENDNSSVIYTELNNHKFLFMGDTGVDKEKDIIDKYNLSNIDVLKVGHHGSKTSSSKDFINEINPKYSIISVGKNNRYGHPNKEVLNNLKDSKIYRTDKDGSIMFKINNNKLKIETCSP